MFKVKRVCIDGFYNGGNFKGMQDTCQVTYQTCEEALNAMTQIRDMFPDAIINDLGTTLTRSVIIREKVGEIEGIDIVKVRNIHIYYLITDLTDPWYPHSVRLQ